MLSNGGKTGQSCGLRSGRFSPRSASRCRSGGSPLRTVSCRRRHTIPDCHLVRTVIPTLPRKGQPRRFPPQSNRLLASFAATVSRSDRPIPWPGDLVVFSDSLPPLKAGYSAHSARGPRPPTHRNAGSSPAPYPGRLPTWEYARHASGSPRKQGRYPHAIRGRPESAGAATRGSLAPMELCLPSAPTPNWA